MPAKETYDVKTVVSRPFQLPENIVDHTPDIR
jgi:hypothetical protein